MESVAVRSEGQTSLNSLPWEILEMIIDYLPDDRDVRAIALVSKQIGRALASRQIWKRRMLSVYDTDKAAPIDWRLEYTKRRRWMHQPPVFNRAETSAERGCLEFLRNLIVEAAPVHGNGGRESSENEIEVTIFAWRSNLLWHRVQPLREGPLEGQHQLQVVQLTLATQSLASGHRPHDFAVSQRAAYAPNTSRRLFFGPHTDQLDVGLGLHVLDVFQEHLSLQSSSDLSGMYQTLTKPHRIAAIGLKGVLHEGMELAQHWKGASGRLEESDLRALRGPQADQGPFREDFGRELQRLYLHVVEYSVEDEPLVRLMVRYDLPDAPPLSFQCVEGFGQGPNGPFVVAGRLYDIGPQWGIPGWKRLVLMVVRQVPALVLLQYFYELVVVPGGRLMLGRWIAPFAHDDHLDLLLAGLPGGPNIPSGPTLLWSVPDGS
ncbi:MAG: hypothetical protein M1826_005458 [Phylliscum demangeonii]|nr:MAG: hypothetical protein M1826_005458 [Phylliscum demangeonii]